MNTAEDYCVFYAHESNTVRGGKEYFVLRFC